MIDFTEKAPLLYKYILEFKSVLAKGALQSLLSSLPWQELSTYDKVPHLSKLKRHLPALYNNNNQYNIVHTMSMYNKYVSINKPLIL